MKAKRKNLYLFIILCLFSFKINGQFIMVNDAIMSGPDCYRLTSATNSQRGQIWSEKMCDLRNDFSVSANIYLGTNNGGADGITFTFQNSCLNVGGGAQGLGAGGISPSLNIEFDTYRNTTKNDPTSDHIAVFKNGNLNHGGVNQLPNSIGNNTLTVSNLENGVWRPIVVTWTASTNTLLLNYQGVNVFSYTGNIVDSIFGGNPYVYWGFTGSTGGANNTQRACITSYPNNQIQLEDQIMCSNDNITYGLPGFSFYAWSPNVGINDTTLAFPTFSPTSTTEYYLEYADTCGTLSYDTVLITVLPSPTANIISDLSELCPGQTANLSTVLLGGEVVVWFKNDTLISGATSANYSTTTTGSYKAVITASNGCTDTSNVITIIPGTSPNASASASVTSFCPGGNSLLTTSLQSGETAQWYYNGNPIGGATNSSYTATQAGNYYVIITNLSGCFGTSNTITITQNALPVAAASFNPSTGICIGTNVTFNGTSSTNATGYSWSFPQGLPSNTSSTNPSPTINFGANGTHNYSLQVTNSCGNDTYNGTITINSPTVTANATTTTICAGAPVTLTGSGASSYSWTNGVTNGVPFNPTTTTTYTVTGTTGNCSDTDQITITVTPLPTVTANATNLSICLGDSVTLTGSGASSYIWNNGATDGVPFNPTNSTTYTVTGTTGSCSNTDQITVTVNTVDTSTNISGNTISANASSATFQWIDCDNNNAIISGETAQSYTPTANGNYAVIVTQGNCTDTSSCINMLILGIDQLASDALVTIYPNPTNGIVTINVNTASLESATIYNTLGKMVYQSTNITNQLKIDLSEMSNGVYLLHTVQNNSSRVHKIIKE